MKKPQRIKLVPLMRIVEKKFDGDIDHAEAFKEVIIKRTLVNRQKFRIHWGMGVPKLLDAVAYAKVINCPITDFYS